MARKNVVFERNKTGLVLGAIFALYHFAWVVLLYLTGGSFYLDMSRIHFIEPTRALEVDLGTAILGTIGAFLVGYITGYVFAWLWEKVK